MQTGYSGAHRHLQLSRDDEGVLVAESNRNGGWFIMNAERHTEFVDALHRSGQDRSGSPMDSPLRLSDYAGAQTSNWDCNQETQDTGEARIDDDPDGNSFDFYVGIASAIGLLLVLIVAAVTAVSIWMLIQR